MIDLFGLFFLPQSIKKKHSNKQEMGTYLRFIVSRMKERVSAAESPASCQACFLSHCGSQVLWAYLAMV